MFDNWYNMFYYAKKEDFYRMRVVDIHTHGIGGFDTSTASRKQIIRMAEVHFQHGVTEILPTIYSDETAVMRLHIETVKRAMEIQAQSENKITTQAKIIGINLEGPFLNPTKCGALNRQSFTTPDVKVFDRLVEGFEDIVKIITIAPELDGAIELIKHVVKRGIIVSMGHSEATYSQAEAGFYAGATGVTHLFNAMPVFHHREPGLTGFALTNKDIYIEVIGDSYHLHPKTIELIFNLKPPEKIILISDSVKEAKTTLATGRIVDSKGTLMGGSMTLMEAAKRLISLGFDEQLVMRTVTDNPQRYLSVLTSKMV
ncbi:N-acetylglucosamine-6-phosphate deacetylase [Candidatus Magnetomonas plexicatena]|uniref:N-acetylglucosamine-6-phosphate deacetylase n=1 Tax=Candidatus Magnetomonas plexicatena TaxID=2552947 RepID=UPI001C778406|nr:amidohydrolase family protein [Nitrospirales bacterium LBB_01]